MFIALTMIWGASFVWIKIAVRDTGPFTVVTWRLVMALLILLPVLIKQRTVVPRGKIWVVLLIQGVMSTAVPWLLITWAEQYIASALATVLNATVPLSTIVLANAFLSDDRMTVSRFTGLLVGFVGVVVLVQKDLRLFVGDVGGVGMQLAGQGAMLLSSFFYGASNVYARVKLRNLTPVFQAFYTMLAADVAMCAVTPAVEGLRLPGSGLSWLAIAWLGMLGAGISYLMFYKLLHEIGPTRVATVTYTIPVVGVALGVIVLGERLDWSLIAGTVLIVSGVRVVTRQ